VTSSDCPQSVFDFSSSLVNQQLFEKEFCKQICSAEFYCHTFKFQSEESQNSEQHTEENLIKCGIMKVVF